MSHEPEVDLGEGLQRTRAWFIKWLHVRKESVDQEQGASFWGRQAFKCQIEQAFRESHTGPNEMKAVEPIRMMMRKLPPPIKKAIKVAVNKLPSNRKSRRHYEKKSVDVFIVSFPKCGRTWLRLMLGKALSSHFGVENINLLQLEQLAAACPEVPLIELTHDGKPHHKTPEELALTKTKYAGKKVILLVRDIRDVVVSCYFEYTRRRELMSEDRGYEGDLSSFLRYERGSVDTIITFYNTWAENRHIPSDFLLVRYEDMHTNTERELRRVLDFMGHHKISDEIVRQAVEYARFENVRRMEVNDAFQSNRLRPGDKNDSESYKTRRGEVGGFVDYLSEADIQYLNKKIQTELLGFYGYDGT